MSEGRRRFSDLTKKEKLGLAVGIPEFFFILAVGLLYNQFFLVKDGPPFHIVGFMNAGKILTAAIVLAPSFFLITIIPAVILFGAILCHLEHQSAFDTLKFIGFALAFLTVPIAFMLALLSFLDLFFSTAPIALQSILMILTFLSVLPVVVRMVKFKKVQELLSFH